MQFSHLIFQTQQKANFKHPKAQGTLNTLGSRFGVLCNVVHYFLWELIIPPWPNFNGSLTKSPKDSKDIDD